MVADKGTGKSIPPEAAPLSPKPTFGLALRAAFKSTASVLHIVGLPTPPADYFPGAEVLAVRLSPLGFERLSTFIHNTYKRDENNRPIPLGPGWYEDSRFYLAQGQYHLFNTCNNWVAQALRTAGSPINPTFAMTAGSVLSQVRTFGTAVRAPTGQSP